MVSALNSYTPGASLKAVDNGAVGLAIFASQYKTLEKSRVDRILSLARVGVALTSATHQKEHLHLQGVTRKSALHAQFLHCGWVSQGRVPCMPDFLPCGWGDT